MDNFNRYIRVFSFIVIALFLALGIFLVFSNYFSYMPKNYRIIFAFLLVAYGSFRLVTIIYKPKTERDNDE
jgi:membrane protease YdiL (CAAX protease family)